MSKPILCLDSHELAWAAGFFDGEGCTTLHKHGDKMPSISLSVSQSVSPETLLRFHRAVGGIGIVRGPYTTRGGEPVFRFDAHGFERSQAVIAMLWKWLSSAKRRQAMSNLEHLALLQRELYRKSLACSRGHLWGGVAGQRGATFLVDNRGTKVCRICIRETSRKRNDIKRQRVFHPRREALAEEKEVQ